MQSAPEFGVILPQFATTWEDLERFARRAEDAGFDSVWAVDHLIGFPRPEDGILEAWTVMSALAAATSRISIGAQVLCQSFRSPALLAKMATTLDLISGDRLRFLVGAGWLEAEYRAFGYPFPPAGDRVAQLEDTVRICRGMFDAGTEAFSYQGRAHSVSDVTNVPAPNRRIPIGIGAVGDRMLDLVARFGDEWNVPRGRTSCPASNSYVLTRSQPVLDSTGQPRVRPWRPCGTPTAPSPQRPRGHQARPTSDPRSGGAPTTAARGEHPEDVARLEAERALVGEALGEALEPARQDPVLPHRPGPPTLQAPRL
jgi:hypothetical protein